MRVLVFGLLILSGFVLINLFILPFLYENEINYGNEDIAYFQYSSQDKLCLAVCISVASPFLLNFIVQLCLRSIWNPQLISKVIILIVYAGTDTALLTTLSETSSAKLCLDILAITQIHTTTFLFYTNARSMTSIQGIISALSLMFVTVFECLSLYKYFADSSLTRNIMLTSDLLVLCFCLVSMVGLGLVWRPNQKNLVSDDLNICISFYWSAVFSLSALMVSPIIQHFYSNLGHDFSYIMFIIIVHHFFFPFYYILKEISFQKMSSTVKSSAGIKTRFLRYISHEIRTPLNSVTLGLQLLEHNISQPSSEKTEQLTILSNLLKACDVAVEVLDKMLTIDRFDSNSFLLTRTTFLLWDTINTTIEPFLLQAERTGIVLVVMGIRNKYDLMNFELYANKEMICQVIRNLVNNAITFTGPGGRVTVSVDLIVIHGKENVQIEVKDTGCGISPEKQVKLFDNEMEFSPGIIQKGSGAGLGLAISKRIVDAHGATLTVHSEGSQQGTTFTVTIPVQSGASERAQSLRSGVINDMYFSSTSFFSETFTSKRPRVDMGGDVDGVDGGGAGRDSSVRWSLRKSLLSGKSVAVVYPTPGATKSVGDEKHIQNHSVRRLKFVNSKTRSKRQELSMKNGDGDGCFLGVTSKNFERMTIESVNTGAHSSTSNLLIACGGSNSFEQPTPVELSDFGTNKRLCDGNEREMYRSVGRGLEAVAYERSQYKFSAESKSEIDVTNSIRSAIYNGENEQLSNSVNNSLGNETEESKSDLIIAERRKSYFSHQRNILIVDDAPLNRTILSHLLAARFAICDQAEDGVEALQMVNKGLAESRVYDIITMDYQMPNMDGPTATKQIRELGFQGLIIGVTGNSFPADIQTFLSHGADAVLSKPLNLHKFDEVVFALLQAKRESQLVYLM